MSKELREEFGKQLSGMTVEVDSLQKQVADLSFVRDSLQQQIADMQARRSGGAESSSSVAWWAAALAAAALTALVAGTAYTVLLRRGTLARLAPAPQPR